MEIIAFKTADGHYVLHKDDGGKNTLTLTNSISEALMVTSDALVEDEKFLEHIIEKVGQPVVAVDLVIMEKANFDELFKIRRS
jgi:uncharacterized protein YkvS